MDQVLVLDSVYWTLFTVNLLPLLVGFVTNEVTKPGVREALLAILTGLAAWAEETFAEGGSFVVEDFVVKAATWFTVAVTMYFGWQRRTLAPPVQRLGFSAGAPGNRPPGAPR